jgi:5,10-methylenetetrahydrofolate reductase
MSRLKDKLASGFAVTCEVAPPKGVDLTEFNKELAHLKGKVDAINVTDLQSSSMKMNSLVPCHFIKQAGLEPVLQMVCRDRNRLALQADLLGAWALGIENVLCLTGDYPTLGDHPEAKPVFDLDSIQLLGAVTKLNGGKDMAGKDLTGKPDLFAGAVVSPASEPVEPQLRKMEKKIKAGAKFFQTQAVYDVAAFEKFMKVVAPWKVPVMAGIVVLKTAGMAKFMNANVAGVNVPANLIDEMKNAPDKAAAGVAIAARLIKDLKGMCQGIHLMPLGWADKVPEILKQAEIK